jgi:hypothetical protein
VLWLQIFSGIFDLYYKSFTIVIYNHNNTIVIYDHNDSGQYYKTMIFANLGLARSINCDKIRCNLKYTLQS